LLLHQLPTTRKLIERRKHDNGADYADYKSAEYDALKDTLRRRRK